mmetsp:Transcript_6932/g.29552  ORF Transcript_6932/g.29552 Transcript_6932/m.29552 type:complete len:412 (+) Transcript_6932:252-1487(+)
MSTNTVHSASESPVSPKTSNPSSWQAKRTARSSPRRSTSGPSPSAPEARSAPKTCHANAALARSAAQYVSGWNILRSSAMVSRDERAAPVEKSTSRLKHVSFSRSARASIGTEGRAESLAFLSSVGVNPGASGRAAAPSATASRYPSRTRAIVAVGLAPCHTCRPKFTRQSRTNRSARGGATSPASTPKTEDTEAGTYVSTAPPRHECSCADASSPPAPPHPPCAMSVASLGLPLAAAARVAATNAPVATFAATPSSDAAPLCLRSHAPTPARRRCRSAALPAGAPPGSSPQRVFTRSHALTSIASSAGSALRGDARDRNARRASTARMYRSHRPGRSRREHRSARRAPKTFSPELSSPSAPTVMSSATSSAALSAAASPLRRHGANRSETTRAHGACGDRSARALADAAA